MSSIETMPSLELTYDIENWPIRDKFTISRGSKSTAQVIVATLTDGEIVARGECVPYLRYGETLASVAHQIGEMAGHFHQGINRSQLNDMLPAGAARNALDCALWDFEAKYLSKSVHRLAGLPTPQPCTTAYTISMDTPEAMASKAGTANYPLLKLKLGGVGDQERLERIREAVPSARLIVDANEGWDFSELPHLFRIANDLGVEMIEQPLPAHLDHMLGQLDHPVPITADESIHDINSLSKIAPCYDAVNIKLDKTGGLTGALELLSASRKLGLGVMIGCMVSTSLSVAPASLLSAFADWVDLDGPLLLSRDRVPGLKYDGFTLYPPQPEIWG